MAYSNSWRFNQSYQERQEAYLRNVSISRSPQCGLRKPKKVVSGYSFTTRGMNCPCTPPNTSRSETSVVDYSHIDMRENYFRNESPGAGDSQDSETESIPPTLQEDCHRRQKHKAKREVELKLERKVEKPNIAYYQYLQEMIDTSPPTSMEELQSRLKLETKRKNERKVQYQYLQEPNGQTVLYNRSTSNPAHAKKTLYYGLDAPRCLTGTRSDNAILIPNNGAQKHEDKFGNNSMHQLPNFGYIPAVRPPKCCPVLKSKSTHAPSSK